MRVRTFSGGGFAENGYLAVCDGSDGPEGPEGPAAAVVVDPGAAADRMARAVVTEELDLQAILLTHAHLDHIEGVDVIRAAVPDVPIWLHRADLGMYRALPAQAASFGYEAHAQPEPEHWLEHGQTLAFGDCSFEVRHAPGHAPGHVIFVSADAGLAFVGDVVFQGSIGRADLPGGDFHTLMRSIREQVLTLPDDMVLYAGHGPDTTVGFERRSNPFLVGHFGGELA